MLLENKAEFEKCNILKWQEDNQGELCTIAVLDEGDVVFPHCIDTTTIPIKMPKSSTGHGSTVIAVGKEIAPKAKSILLPFHGYNEKQKCIDYIKDHVAEIDIINVSLGMSNLTAKKYFDQLKDLDIPIICSSGNDDKDKVDYPARFDYTIAVGAYSEYHDARDRVSNYGEMLDCIAPTWMAYLNSRGEEREFNGTSCSAPFVSYALALYITWRKKKGLPRLGREDIRIFIHNNCIDYGAEGFDIKHGHGLFCLPLEVRTLEYIIVHHTGAEEKDAQQIKDYHVNVRGWRDIGYNFVIERDGKVVSGRPLDIAGAHCSADGMNLKSIGVALIGDFTKRQPTQEQLSSLKLLLLDLTVKHKIKIGNVLGHREVKGANTQCPGGLNMGALRQFLQGDIMPKQKTVTSDVAPHIYNGRTMVPVRAFAEAIGGVVGWEPEQQLATIELDGKRILFKIGDPKIIVEEV